MIIRPARPDDAPAIAALLDACFGPARGRRTAALLRAGACPERAFVADACGRVIGSVQLWPVELRAPRGAHGLTLLGPLATAPDRRGEGIGGGLMDAALAAHDAAGGPPVVLIGDAPYYGRWGFAAEATGGWLLPGPVDRARLLLRGGGLPVAARLCAVADPMRLAA